MFICKVLGVSIICKGARVEDYEGSPIGEVLAVSGSHIDIGRRLWGIGPVVPTERIAMTQIAAIDNVRIQLSPAQADYWQTPA